MSERLHRDDRLEELLAAAAVESLSIEERAELDDLLASLPADEARRRMDEYAVLAGAIAGAGQFGSERAMPESLRGVLVGQGVALVSGKAAHRSGGRVLVGPAGWAMAACMALVAAIGFLRQSGAPVDEPAWVMRNKLIEQHADTVVLNFTRTDDAAAKSVVGDVVWNQRLQKGFIRLTGLPRNDPSADQYQAWIFDKTRGEYAVDAGVFDADPKFVNSANGELVIPIDAKLVVRDPAAFAITVEQPGGVVVTKKQRVVALAASDGGAKK